MTAATRVVHVTTHAAGERASLDLVRLQGTALSVAHRPEGVLAPLRLVSEVRNRSGLVPGTVVRSLTLQLTIEAPR